eukprot:5811643-Pleurochrysis_carterae.AAC.2
MVVGGAFGVCVGLDLLAPSPRAAANVTWLRCQQSPAPGSGAGAGAGRSYGRGGYSQGAYSGQRQPCAFKQWFKSWGGEKQALRKYACDANAIWYTMHASDEMGHATAIARIVRRAMISSGNAPSGSPVGLYSDLR